MDKDEAALGPVVATASGLVRGKLADGVRRFLGIPYAAPPAGPNRFREPQPVERWDSVRNANTPGPSAPYRIRPFPGLDVLPLVGNSGESGDDYLRLNIWAPEEARDLPVMVFVHGGGFVLGSKDSAVQDGTALARAGVVSVNLSYRLNIDGFLPIPGVPTNLGLRDIIAALGWVRDNIAAFGGDPGNVTLFGESAGAMATANLVASPLAQGLFGRAIVQSGHGSMVRELKVAQRLVNKLARLLGIHPTAEGFAAVPFDRVWAAMEKAGKPIGGVDLRDADGFEPVYGISRFIPVYGDDVLPQHPLRALEAGVGRDIDLLIGTNAEEMNLYFVPTGVRRRIPSLMAWWLLGRSTPHARAALKAYGLGSGKRPGEAMTDAMTDLVFRWPARQFAAAHGARTHVYEMEWRSPAFGGELGACHGIELPFVFNTLATVSGPSGLAGEQPPQELADRVQRLWVDFARDGTLPWPAFDAGQRQVYQLAAGRAVAEPVMPAAAFTPRSGRPMVLERFRLDGQTAFVTGGGQGIGLAAAAALAEAGAVVTIADRDPAILERGRAALAAGGHDVVAVELDVTDSAAVTAAAEAMASRHGRIDILVNNAGIARSETAAEDVADEHWLNVLDVNLNGTFWCARAFGRHMLAAGRGAIVNVGSMSGFIVNRPQPQSYYNASKAAVHQLTRSLAAEWASRGVRVNAVAPTYIATPLNAFADPNSELVRRWIDGTPMGRLGEPDEVAAVILFLASPAASLLTGSIVLADGGYTCW